jgi:hypothetical protein
MKYKVALFLSNMITLLFKKLGISYISILAYPDKGFNYARTSIRFYPDDKSLWLLCDALHKLYPFFVTSASVEKYIEDVTKELKRLIENEHSKDNN